MADYWTQTCLFNLHKATIAMLGKIDKDVTIGQDIAPFGVESERYHSFDLTAATDRIPVEIYEGLYQAWKGTRWTQEWKNLMINYDFDYAGNKVKYSTGQPKGIYSSWTSLALGHHLIVQYSALKVGKPNFKDYRLLGDDIVIRDDRVALSYTQVMTSLGVEISPTKTLVSEDTFEFAKRLFHKGEEVTGFPLAALISDQRSWLAIYTA
jgi:hypothetical protein